MTRLQTLIATLVAIMGLTSAGALLAIFLEQASLFYALSDISFACLVMIPILGIFELTKPKPRPRGASRRV